jgi:hypothetical protein
MSLTTRCGYLGVTRFRGVLTTIVAREASSYLISLSLQYYLEVGHLVFHTLSIHISLIVQFSFLVLSYSTSSERTIPLSMSLCSRLGGH